MALDPLRHLKFFSPEKFGNRRVDVIGAGATGSSIVLELAKLGVKNLHVWDFDNIEPHNLANQAYSCLDVGRPKVEALYDIVSRDAGLLIKIHNEKVTENTSITGEIVILQVDTMSARREIGSSLYYGRTGCIIETRMGEESGYVYTFNPNSPKHISAWEKTLYADENTEDSACGSPTVVSATAKLVSGYAVWQFIKWANDEDFENEILFCTRPLLLQTRSFPLT